MAVVRLVLVVALWLPLPAGLLFGLQLLKFANELPDVPDIETLRPEHPTRVETIDGWYLGGSHYTRSVPFEELPTHVVAAFIAAEDENFFSHQALSFRGILRAALENYKIGRTVQGASTITQQVARQFLTTEKTYERKVKEILLARRLEATYSKVAILDVYLDSVFMGHTAYGVTQASWFYFGKSPVELDVGEAAVLAGVLPAPNHYSPVVDMEQAIRERARVLRRMRDIGALTTDEMNRWNDAEIVLTRDEEIEQERMPRAFQTGLRFANALGDQMWESGGATIVVPHQVIRQARARDAVRQGVIALDRRQGWRGVPARSRDDAAVDERLDGQQGRFVLGRVEAVERDEATVVVGREVVKLALEDSRWAEPDSTRRHYKRPVELDEFAEILQPGDLVFVDRQGRPQLFQPPAYEGLITAVDTATGRLRAAVGGFDADLDEFDRVFQGCRQPGSVFKPVVYSEALSKGLTPATMLSDVPTEVATGRGDVWRPKNADRDFKGYVTLANALAWSRNIPTVNLMDHLGPSNVVARAKRLGVTESKLDTTSSVSLGASCLRPYEVVQVFGAFQRSGRVMRVSPVSWWVDDQGAARDDALHFAVEDWRVAARLSRMARVAPLADRGISENVAYIMQQLLRRVVTSGTAHELPDEWMVAGKTGTTNEYDGWFVGFDGRQTVAAWIGSDKNERPLGRG
jgi:penicillin-binding protein 1A